MKRLFFDIETSPNVVLSWRTGYKLNIPYDNILQERAIICIAYKWENESKAKVLKWDKNSDDEAMLRKFMGIAAEADEIVAHNGDRFDIKWVRTRCMVHGIDAFPTYKTIDTFKWAKSHFYFNSNAMDYIAQLLGLDGKVAHPYSLWMRAMEGDRKAVNEIAEYCKNDVHVLQAVYEYMANYCPHKTHAAVANGGEKWMCAHCESTNTAKAKTRVTALGTKQHQMKCGDCYRYYTISNTTFEKWLEERP